METTERRKDGAIEYKPAIGMFWILDSTESDDLRSKHPCTPKSGELFVIFEELSVGKRLQAYVFSDIAFPKRRH
jgi:hypothetical protein